MLKRGLLFHVLPFILGCIIFVCIYFLFISDLINSNRVVFNSETKTITGNQNKYASVLPNLILSDSLELEFMASIKNTNQLTLFGSSEFSSTQYASYNYLPNTKEYQVLGIGHAHHQSLSILIELLAAHNINKKTKVVFFISPGWFDTDGTNSEAFTEFARPNFLNKIVIDKNISDKYKKHLGRFIDLKQNEFDGNSRSMKILKNFYVENKIDMQKLDLYLNENFSGTQKPKTNNIKYNITRLITKKPKNITINYDSIAFILKRDFLLTTTNNNICVYDDYFFKYLMKEDSTLELSTIDKINISKNEEYKDFKLLIEYINEREMEASFIIIPLNPHYYTNTNIYAPLIDSITTTIKKYNLPYYNLFAMDTTEYEPAILKDIMHFGDYGWMKVNKYIDSLYYGNH